MLKSEAILSIFIITLIPFATALIESGGSPQLELTLSYPAKGLVLQSVLVNKESVLAKNGDTEEYFICHLEASEQPCSEPYPLNPLTPRLKNTPNEEISETESESLEFDGYQVVLVENQENSTSVLNAYTLEDHKLVYSYELPSVFKKLYYVERYNYLLVLGCDGGLYVFDVKTWTLIFKSKVGSGCLNEIFMLGLERLFLRYFDSSREESTFAVFNLRLKQLTTYTINHKLVSDLSHFTHVLDINQEWHVALQTPKTILIFDLCENFLTTGSINPSDNTLILSALYINEKHSMLISTENKVELWRLEGFASHFEGPRKIADLSEELKIVLIIISSIMVISIIYFAVIHKKEKSKGSGYEIPMLSNGEYV